MRQPRIRFTARAGFTLVEMLLSVTLLVGLILLVGLTSQKATDAFDGGTAEEALNTRAHRALERLIEPFEEAQLAYTPGGGAVGLTALALGDTTVTYHTAVDIVGGVVQWGPDTLLALELDPGEVDDGADNDGDGLVDEGQLVWTDNPGVAGERRVIVCRGVSELLEGELPNGLDDNGNGFADEEGFFVDVQGQVLTMRLSLQALDPDGRLQTKSVDSSIRIRN